MTRRQEPRRPVKSRPAPLDAAGVTRIDYKDTDLLRRFISDRGKSRGRRVTRVTAQQQRRLAAAIKNAREMALLPCSSRQPPPAGRTRPGRTGPGPPRHG